MREPSLRAARRRAEGADPAESDLLGSGRARGGRSPRVPSPLLPRRRLRSQRCAGLAATGLLRREAREQAVRRLDSSAALCRAQYALCAASRPWLRAAPWRGEPEDREPAYF
jgi:hypothetical protein